MISSLFNLAIFLLSPLATLLGWCMVLFLIFYLGSHILLHNLPEQNLKKKYQANWAFVSGGSSGLGYAIAEKLAGQGLNIVLCALDDKLLTDSHAALQKKFPEVEIRKVGVNLGDSTGKSYLDVIKKATADISVQIVFSNAGAIVIALFPKTPAEKVAINWSLNITSHVEITHYFFQRMVEEKKKGCIVYTSSNAGFWPSPTSTLYGAAKAAMMQLASSLAVEGHEYGIDVTALCSGPMATRFVEHAQGANNLDALKSFMKVASTPEQVAHRLLGAVGRVSVYDDSPMTLALRVLFRFVDTNFFVRLVAFAQPFTPDWKKIEH